MGKSQGSSKPSRVSDSGTPTKETRDLLTRSVDSSGQISWKINPGVTQTKKLRFLCKIYKWMETYPLIRTKDLRLTNFHFNEVQMRLAQEVARCWYQGVPVDQVIIKGRQQGVSTFWQIFFLALAELIPGYRTVVVAHDDEGAGEVFSRVRTAVRGMELAGEWPDIHFLSKKESHYVWATESSIQTGTIKTGDALGKGGTPSAIHYSEGASYSDKGFDAKKPMGSLNGGLAQGPLMIRAHETTAKGKDPIIYPMVMEALDPDSASTVTPIFFPWVLTPEYSMTWEDYRKRLVLAGKNDPGPEFEPTEEEQEIRAKMASVEVRPGEEMCRYRLDITDEQFIWRRWTIANDHHGDVDEFKRYYPFFLEEAFTTSAACMFDAATIDWYRNMGRAPQGKFELLAGPILDPNPEGRCEIWEYPKAGHEYTIGADPGGEKTKSDPYQAYVIDNDTHEAVARLGGHFEWDDFADQLIELGYLYNSALIVCENNHNRAIVKRLFRKNYPRLYHYFEQDKANAREGGDPGFNTNRKTRGPMLKTLRRVCRQKILSCYDPELCKEMETFIWVPRNAAEPDRDGDYRAVGVNKDDRVMALALAYTQIELPEVEVRREHEVPDKPSKAYRMFLQLEKEQKQQRDIQAGEFLSLLTGRGKNTPSFEQGVLRDA